MEYKIEKHVAIPDRSKWGDIVTSMQIEDSVLLNNMNEARSLCRVMRKRQQKGLVRTTPDGVRVWRIK